MRIIAGVASGRRLASPSTKAIRPTADRVREALFSMLGDIEGAVVVDGFAGSGAVGLEALSRGAERCYFFDTSREAISTIEENIQRVRVEERSVVRRRSFVGGLSDMVEETPDLWFLDPPYGSGLAEEGLRAMSAASEIVTQGALVVWESDSSEDIPSVVGFEEVRKREYGSTRLVFFRRVISE